MAGVNVMTDIQLCDAINAYWRGLGINANARVEVKRKTILGADCLTRIASDLDGREKPGERHD